MHSFSCPTLLGEALVHHAGYHHAGRCPGFLIFLGLLLAWLVNAQHDDTLHDASCPAQWMQRSPDGTCQRSAVRNRSVVQVLLFDYRLKHRGIGNQSDTPRPVLYLTYSRQASAPHTAPLLYQEASHATLRHGACLCSCTRGACPMDVPPHVQGCRPYVIILMSMDVPNVYARPGAKNVEQATANFNKKRCLS